MPAVRIRDISPRLAFQASVATTDQKVELVERLIAAGLKAIEVSSFVHPKLVPGLADAEQVFARIGPRDGVSLECCVGNVTGLKRAIDAGADAAWFLLAADDEFSMANVGRSIADSLAELARMRALAEGTGTRLGTYLIAAFGGPSGLARGPRDLEPLARSLLELDVRDWILADSCGYAAPPQVQAMLAFATTLTDRERLTVQLHDARGMGLADVAELSRLGIANIDTSLAGSGGHPAAPDARGIGGVCTEDAVQMLHLMGVETGLDLPALLEAADWLDDVLGGGEKGQTRRVGPVPMTAAQADAARARRADFKWAPR